ncbi:hypothetical protein MBLNU230_g1480t1 [Neophaeotheca triangularis]
MSKDESAQHLEHESALTGVVALAGLFSNCVEAFGLVHPAQKWDKEEQVLLARLGIQQARLLIWGDIVGIHSPPKSVTNRAVPKHPSLAYPDLKEPTFFGERDARLDETETRVKVEEALNGIVDRSVHMTREEMMEVYGLKPPKKPASGFQPALDTNRLEAFREKYELLQEVAESYAHLNTRRSNSITMQNWTINDTARFAIFIVQTQERVDTLINLFDVKDRVDRGVRMDVRALGWHISNDRTRTTNDISKLRLIQQACQDEYPEYVTATQEALNQIERERKENSIFFNPLFAEITPPSDEHKTPKPETTLIHRGENSPNGKTNNKKTTPPTTPSTTTKQTRPSFFSRLKSFGRPKPARQQTNPRSSSLSPAEDPVRSKSDSGPTVARDYGSSSTTPTLDSLAGGKKDNSNNGAATATAGSGAGASLDRVRSKSVGDILDVAPGPRVAEGDGDDDDDVNVESLGERIAKMSTRDGEALVGVPSRHDQYHGIGRTDTREVRQEG